MEVLAVTYHLNETRTKSVTVGHDVNCNFEPFIWIYKVGTQRIKLTPEAWMELMNLKDEVDTHFHQDTYKFLTLSIDNSLTVSFVESHGNRLLCLEQFEWPVKPTNQPKSPVKLWLSDKQWSVLRSVKTCVDTIFDRYLKSANEILNLFETLGDCINVAYGTSLRRSYGDLVQLQRFLEDYDDSHLLYSSTNNLDVQRALLEIKTLCLPQLRDFVKYCNSNYVERM
jgi:hypothetical protein